MFTRFGTHIQKSPSHWKLRRMTKSHFQQQQRCFLALICERTAPKQQEAAPPQEDNTELCPLSSSRRKHWTQGLYCEGTVMIQHYTSKTCYYQFNWLLCVCVRLGVYVCV